MVAIDERKRVEVALFLVLLLGFTLIAVRPVFASTISLTVAPNPAPEDGGGTRVTFSGTEVPAHGGATIYIGIFDYGGCSYAPAITRSTTELPSGAYVLVLTTGDIEAGGTIGEYSALAFDPPTNALSACQSFVITIGDGGPNVTPLRGVVITAPCICIIQLGVQESGATITWLPGYAYPGTQVPDCQNKTDFYTDVLDRTIAIHQFNQTR